jgi:hypothetical protein
MFFIVATVGLEAEHPVEVERVFGAYFGTVLPIFMAAIIARLFWPILPESELRKRLIEFFSICSNFLTKPPGHGDEALSSRLTLIPIEAVNWVRGLQGLNCPETEVDKWLSLTLTMRRLALHLSTRARRGRPALPESITGLVHPRVLKAREKFREISESLSNIFREGSTRVDVPTALEARESFREVLEEVRRKNLLAGQSLEAIISFLSLSHRLEVIARFGELPQSSFRP